MVNRLLRSNLKFARSRWKSDLNQSALQLLKALTNRYQFSIAEGDLIWLERGWYATHTGLIRLASRNRCAGIHCKAVANFCDPQTQRWAFEATVYKSKACRGFVGYGDADPSNVSALVHGAEMRVAETRAVNRALRKAYGIGICSVEEIGSFAGAVDILARIQETSSATYQWQTTADAPSAIISANSFASISSTPPWSSRMRPTSVGSRPFAKPPVSRSKTSSLTWPTGPRKTAMPCSASSTAISARKKVPHETPHRRSRTRPISLLHLVRDGLFLVRVERAQYRWHARKPFYLLRFSILEPKELAGHLVNGRLYCSPKALWKLNWFLRDFGYDTELLGRDEIDDKSLIGLRGVVKISHVVLNGTSLLNLDGFAPASQWEELSTASSASLMARR